jgi:hypothetical protein
MKILEPLAKTALFFATLAFILFGLEALYWPSIYTTTPVLAPFAPYFEETRIAPQVGYLLMLAGLSGFLARSKSWPRSIAILLGVCVGAALVAHATLNALGYNYFMETP